MDSYNVKLVKRLLEALEDGASSEVLEAFYRPDIVQVEFPNRATPRGTSRNFEQVKQAAERGRGVVRTQRYDVLRVFEFGATVIVEARWSAELHNPPPGAPAGMAASLAMFFEFTDGKIAAQRNYDCFDPP
jgi:ketosteroid isomerase-like protein